MELIGSLLSGRWSQPRLAISALLGIGAGAGLFFLTGKEPASTAMAAGGVLLGLAIGFVLEYFRDTPRGPLD